MSAPVRKAPATVADLLPLWKQGLAVELIEGEIVHKAQPSIDHGSTQFKFGELLAPFNRRGGPRGPGGWWIMTEVDTFYAKTGEVFRHDVSGYRRDLHEVRPTGMPTKTRPDWVCEILSPSNARVDLMQKQRTLHAHEVPHYWIVDPEHETLTVLRRTDAGYLHVLAAGVGDLARAEPFEAIELSIAELFGHEE